MGKNKSKAENKGLISISANPPAISNSDGMMFIVMALLGASSPVCTLLIFGSDIMNNLNYVIIALVISITLLIMGYYSLATKYRTRMYNEIKGLNVEYNNQDTLPRIHSEAAMKSLYTTNIIFQILFLIFVSTNVQFASAPRYMISSIASAACTLFTVYLLCAL